MTEPPREAGFTLIEVIISLALFALIALAGVAMIDGVLRVQGATNGRLERLGDIQRAMFVIANDLQQVAAGPVGGTGTALSFNRPLDAKGGAPSLMGYRLERGTILRDLGPLGRQRLLDGVAAIGLHYHAPGAAWIDHWPPDPKHVGEWPAAIALDVVLTPVAERPGGTLRRVVALPAQP